MPAIVILQSRCTWELSFDCPVELGMFCDPQSVVTLVSDFQASCCGLLSSVLRLLRERALRAEVIERGRPPPRRFSPARMLFVNAGQERRNLPVVGAVTLGAGGALCRDWT